MKFLKLTNSQKQIIVDDEDYIQLLFINWHLTDKGYAQTNMRQEDGKFKSIKLHRYILDIDNCSQVDHINHNTLDNRKSNLRIVNGQQNQFNQKLSRANTTGYKGVSYHKRIKKYTATITKTISNIKVKKHLGYYDSPIAAALAYNYHAKMIFGEYAFLNKFSKNTERELETLMEMVQ